MSYSFYVDSPVPPPLRTLVDRKRFPTLRCEETRGAGLSGSLVPGSCRHYHLPKLSSRGVEVRWIDGRVEVRVFTCCSFEDHALALHMVQRLARHGAVVESDEGDRVDAAGFVRLFDDAWIRRQIDSGADVIKTVAEREGAVHLSGPNRSACIGPRTVSRLLESGPSAEFPQRLVQALLAVQWVDTDRWYAANLLRVRENAPQGDSDFAVCAWAPRVAYLFPPCDWLAVQDDDETILVPPSRVDEIADGHCTWLDEAHVLVDAVPKKLWPALVERAQRCDASRRM